MNVPLSKITNLMVQAAINNAAKTLSAKSVRNAHGLLTASVAMYMPDFVFHTTLPAKEHKVKDLPTPQQIADAIKGTDIELPAMLAMWLSLRMSEVRGIRYKDISNGILTVRNVRIAMAGQIEKEKTKTFNSTRRLSVPERLLDMIGSGNPDDYVVDLAASTIYKHFVNIIFEKTGKHMTFHDLRHINASIMLALGVPDKYAMERGGWSTPSTLKNVYQHTFSEERAETDQKIDNYMDGLFSDNK